MLIEIAPLSTPPPPPTHTHHSKWTLDNLRSHAKLRKGGNSQGHKIASRRPPLAGSTPWLASWSPRSQLKNSNVFFYLAPPETQWVPTENEIYSHRLQDSAWTLGDRGKGGGGGGIQSANLTLQTYNFLPGLIWFVFNSHPPTVVLDNLRLIQTFQIFKRQRLI